jgi:hypothetical protein
MKEKIYTIPVNEAFGEDCECPLCVLEKKLEEEYVSYFLGPSLMEPDSRAVTNEKGFCRRHFELMYNSRENMLGLGLMVYTHLCRQNEIIKRTYESKSVSVEKETGTPFIKSLAARLSQKQTETNRLIDELVALLEDLEGKCSICSRLESTMDRYVDVVLYLWSRESDFRERFGKTKGFCLRHLKDLLKGAKKYLSPGEAAGFTTGLMNLQLSNMERIRQEVDWFTRKFDYRNNDAPWGNSKDALPRSIQKIVGHCALK